MATPFSCRPRGRSLGLHAENPPDSAIEIERGLVTQQVITWDLEGPAGAVLQNDVEMVARSQALLRTAVFRLGIVADGLRGHRTRDVGLPLPDVPVHLEHAVAEVTGRLGKPEAHRRPCSHREDGGS